MNWTPGTKYVRRGGGYYIYHGETEAGLLIAEYKNDVFIHHPNGWRAGFADDDMLPEVYRQPIKYSKVVYLADAPFPSGDTFDLVRHLFGRQVRWSEMAYERYTIPVRVTIETIEDGE